MYGYYGYYDDYNIQQTKSYARILHASPNAPGVDVYVNDKILATNLTYKNFTEYYPLDPGLYNIKVYPTGQRENPVINSDIRVPPRGIYTIAAINKLENIALYPILDTPQQIPSGRVYARFVHLSPGAPNVDVKTGDDNMLFSNVAYKGVTEYKLINPGTYTFNVFAAGTDDRVLYVPNITLKPNRFYTIYAVGLVEGNPPLQVLIPLDGNSYLNV
ncbi:DUF4397 domain-containing protein [Sporosalibacterium faouarense]|uniref:DUF4397 domain-containing protein n=1 Tax=Sporosalibacterium faouarense TaxID=516123 RepID=UPI00141CB440|nr:DUF4397 domain-containing protein [Sporosalibacterium faouarense]MTI47814.1 DUF4397 domain-containing protein [Bacillota bacterium]